MTWTIRKPLTLGLLTCLGLFLAIFVWGAWASLAGAVIAQGQVAVEARRQVIQHPDGGIVAGLEVTDGKVVAQGETLLVLDGADLQSQRGILAGQLLELKAQGARLKAERDDAAEVAFPEGLDRFGPPEAVADVVEGQASLFKARLATLEETARSFSEQKAQVKNEIEGLESQLTSVAEQLRLNQSEQADAEALFAKGLLEASRVTAFRRETARLAGVRGQVEANIASDLGRIAQLDVELLQMRAERRERAVADLREVEARVAGLTEQLNAVETKLARLEMKAPMAGIVHDLSVHTIGSVIRPADPVLYVIPGDQPLTILAQVDVFHVDSVHVGQPARLRFSAFEARVSPEVDAEVIRVSPDITVDERTGAPYYTVELAAKPAPETAGELAALLPGMPVEVYIKTADRSPLSYALQPFLDYFNRAFRE